MSSPIEPVPLLPSKSDQHVPILEPAAFPNIDDLVIQDDEPVDNLFVEKQQRLLTEPLYSSWSGPGPGRSFKALANVGLFYADKQPAVVPDIMLAIDIPANVDLGQKKNRSYFTWIIGKAPDVVIEIVSDRRGGEDQLKRATYAQIGVPYYVIFDPDRHLSTNVLRVMQLQGSAYELLENHWFPKVELGLQLWEGAFELQHARWLRWCDKNDQLIATGKESTQAQQSERQAAEQRAESEKRERITAEQRAEAEQRERLAAEQRAEAEQRERLAAEQRAEAERREKLQAQDRVRRLADQLRALGIEPTNDE